VDKNVKLAGAQAASANIPARIEHPALLVRDYEPKVPLELLYSFVAFQGATQEGRVYAFTSVRRREGVSYVVHMLGSQLARYCEEDVIIISPPDLRRLRPLDVEQIEIRGRRVGPQVWTVPQELSDEHDDAAEEEDLWKILRRRFRYILVDCSALECSAEIFSLAPRIDGTVLVVRAGFSPKPAIQRAARLLGLGPAAFVGCILNRRTYPVPDFLYRFL
jgi:hypothetical protein